MPDTTTTLNFPFGTLSDSPVDLLSVPALAQAVEDYLLLTDPRPVGDSSLSQVLTSGDIAFTANDNKNILTTGAVTYTRDQWVLVAGHCAVHNATSGASGYFALYIDFDATPISGATSGVIWVGNQGSIEERREFSVPMHSIFVTAGSHTIRLRGDRDSTVATHNVSATDTLNQTHHPTRLTVIV